MPRHQISGDTNPDGWGVAWYDAPHTAPDWYRTVTPDLGRRRRSRRVPRSLRSGAFLAAARLASPGRHARRHRQRAVRRRHVVVLAQRHRARLPRRRRRRAAGARRPGASGAASSATPTPRCCSRWCCSTSTTGSRPAEALATVVHDVLAITTGRLNLLLTDGAARARDARRQLAVPPRAGDRRPNPPTTSRAGSRSPTTRSRCSPPTAPPTPRSETASRTSEGSSMTTDVTVDVHLEPDDAAARARSRRARRPRRHAEDAAAEVVLRRPRQRAVRRDHPAARVLPHPHRALDPRRARARRRRAHQGRHAGRARLGHVGEDAAAPRRAPRRGHARTLRALRRERADAARRGRRGRATSTPACACTRSSATSSTTSASSPAAAPASSRSSAAPSATSRPQPRARFLADLAATLAPGDALLLGTDLVKDVDRLVAAYDDAAGVTAAFNRNVLSVLNRELDADFDPARVRPRRACGTPTPSGSRCGCARGGRRPSHIARARARRRVRRGRGAAHRDQRQVPPRRRRAGARRRRASSSPSGGPIPPATSRSRSRSSTDARILGPMPYHPMSDDEVRAFLDSRAGRARDPRHTRG